MSFPPSGAASIDDAAPRNVPRRSDRLLIGTISRYRVVFAGPVGVGKTTAVRAISEVETVETEMPLTPGTEEALRFGEDKSTTTVGIDYGIWRPRDNVSVALVGTPGQHRFTDARASFNAPSTRVLLWLYGDSDDLIEQAESWLPSIGDAIHRLALVVTRTTDGGERARAELAPMLARYGGSSVPVLAADARIKASVVEVVSRALDLPGDPA
jgi:uncharacterized protein